MKEMSDHDESNLKCDGDHHHILDCFHHEEMSNHNKSNLECYDVGWSSEADLTNSEADYLIQQGHQCYSLHQRHVQLQPA